MAVAVVSEPAMLRRYDLEVRESFGSAKAQKVIYIKGRCQDKMITYI